MTTPPLAQVSDDPAPVLGPWGSSRESEDTCRALAGWLGSRIDALAADAADRIWDDLPSYRATELHEDVGVHISRIYRVFVTTVDEARDPHHADFSWTAQHARLRVQHGISLAEFLTAFRIAQLTLWESVLTWTRSRPGSEQDVLHLVSHLMRTIEAASAVAARTYLEAQQYDLADLENLQRVLVEDLLTGRTPTRAHDLALLHDAGLDADRPFTIAAIRLTDTTAKLGPEVLARSARTHLSRATGGIYALRDSMFVAVIPASTTGERGLRQRLTRVVEDLAGRGTHLQVGLGTSHTDLTAAPDVHAEAVLALDSVDAAYGVKALCELSTLDYLLGRPDDTVLRLVRPQVRAFVTEDRAGDGTYAESLQAYIDHDLNARDAARSLHVHVNTMYYRLERIAERTGCDLRRIDEVIELLIAVRMLGAERS